MWIIPLITTCVRHFDPWSGNFQNPHVLGDSKCKGSHGRDVCVSCNMIQKLQKIALLHRSCTFRLWWGTRSFPRLAERKEETVCMVHRGVSPSLGLPHIKCAFNAFCSCNTYKMNRYPPPPCQKVKIPMRSQKGVNGGPPHQREDMRIVLCSFRLSPLRLKC